MGLLSTIIITLVISSPLHCQTRPRQGISSLLQNLLKSNPQLLKMAGGRPLCNPRNTMEYSRPYGEIPIGLTNQYLGVLNQKPQFQGKYPVNEMPYPKVFKEAYQVQNYKNYQPVVPVKETPYPIQQIQYPVSQQIQYPVSQQVQSVSQSFTAPGYPAPKPCVAPAAMVNPFLPAASPVSALAPPTSSLLPPAIPSLSRSNYLRKIPIPPPCM